jgi:hypothetical protein
LRVLEGVCFRGSFEFELFFWFIAFLTICWFCDFFLLLDDFLKLLFGFWSSSCASCDLEFEIQTLCIYVINVLTKGEIEKPSGP